MAKYPALLFYTSDFLTGTMTLNFEDKGKYITILCTMHHHGRLTQETICFLVGSVSDNLKAKFRIDENGLWYNERLELEAEKRKNYTDSRKNNGLKGGRPKKQNHMLNHMQNHMATHTEDENINEDENVSIDKEYNTWETSKRTFLQDGGWKIQFMTGKQVDKETLETLMQDFITDIELREDFKPPKELRSHFTNLFNKLKKHDTNKSGSRKSTYEDYKRLFETEWANLKW